MSWNENDADMTSANGGGKNEASEDQIGDFVTVEDLGVGGYSRVKLAQHKQTKQYVAVKILLSEPKNENGTVNWVISDSKVKQCRREIKLMKNIQHKNVVGLVDYIEDATFPQKNKNGKLIQTPCLCVVLEYCSRGELFDFLMYTGRLGERATRTYFHQFLNGLQAMHKSGYAHRDLKPENLLLSDDFTLKIADFGFATQFKDNNKKIKMATTCGTKGYLAPELLAGHKYTHKVDLFAVGIIMFTTFAGFPPFQHAGTGDWWWDKMSKAWTYWTEAAYTNNEIEGQERFKKGNEKMRLFWAAHERSCAFEDNFKELMQHLLNPYPKQRYDIDQCFKHSWMKGKTFSRRQLMKYMKQYSSTVRAQRAIKIQKQIQEMTGAARENTAKRILLDMNKPEQFEKLCSEFEKIVDKTDENEALVNKVRFKFETEADMLQLLARIDTVVRQQDGIVDMNEEKAELKIVAGVTRKRELSKKDKGTLKDVWEVEDVQVMVKVYRPEISTFDENTNNYTFDIDGNFLDDDDDKDDENDDGESQQKEVKKSTKAKDRFAVLFYRIEGSADGFQQLMSKVFYSPLLCEIMDVGIASNVRKEDRKKLEKMEDSATAFRDLEILQPPKPKPQAHNDLLVN